MRSHSASLLALLRRAAACQRGATAIEYGLIVALIVVVVFAGISVLGRQTGAMWTNISAKVAAVTPNG